MGPCQGTICNSSSSSSREQGNRCDGEAEALPAWQQRVPHLLAALSKGAISWCINMMQAVSLCCMVRQAPLLHAYTQHTLIWFVRQECTLLYMVRSCTCSHSTQQSHGRDASVRPSHTPTSRKAAPSHTTSLQHQQQHTQGSRGMIVTKSKLLAS